MSESEWLVAADPTPMLQFLGASGKLSERKALLFAAAVCRRTWPLLTDERSRRAVEVVEQHADGRAGDGELRPAALAADRAAYRVARAADQARRARQAAAVAQGAASRATAKRGASAAERADQVARRAAQRAEKLAAQAEATHGVREAARAARLCVRGAWYRSLGPGGQLSFQQAAEAAAAAVGKPNEERRLQSQLVHDIVGNPFLPLLPLPASELHWHDGIIVKMANAVYEDRDLPFGHLAPTRLAVLADALEEAGCTDADLLGHLRSPGPHVRGCWVLDLLTGRS
jgi:hypothetical protein